MARQVNAAEIAHRGSLAYVSIDIDVVELVYI